MKQWNYLPPALLRKILLTILAGVAFLGAGIIFAYLTKDYDLILLSLLIFGFCLSSTSSTGRRPGTGRNRKSAG